jgi:nicotinamidase-related amidase
MKATALDALGRGLDVTVLSEAARAVNRAPNYGADALDELWAPAGTCRDVVGGANLAFLTKHHVHARFAK